MGEFVGITPGPANALRGRMTKATSQANSIRGRLAADIATAAGDWTGGTGAEALSRTASFLTTAERDLNWRITTITHAPGVKWDHGMATAQFAFADLAAAEAAGRAKGGELAKLWAQYKQDPTLANYNRFLAAMKVGEGDPGYDAGLLKGLGADNYRAIFEEWMKLKKDPTGHGVNPAELKQLIHDLGPLARALAVADVPDLRRNLLKKGSPDVISALLVMTPQSKEFVVEAGKYLAGAVTNHTTDPNWNLRWLYTALDQNPVAFQAVLASSLETANRLLSPTVLGEGDIRDLTTRAITKAMNEGLNDPTRRQAIANIAGSFSPGIDRNPQLRAALVAALTRELDNQPTRRDFFQKLVRSLAAAGKPAPALREKDINQLFARHLVSFLPEISGLEATRNDPNLKMDPGDGWSLVSHDDLVNVINGVIIDPDGYKTLRNGLYRFQSTLDMGTGDLNDPRQRDLVLRAMARNAGIGGLLVEAVDQSDQTAEQHRKLLTELLVIPLDIGIGRFAGATGAATGGDHELTDEVIEQIITKFTETQTKNPTTEALDKAMDQDEGWATHIPVVGGWFRSKPNVEPTAMAKALAEMNMKAYDQRLRQEHKPPLSTTDRILLQNTIQGLYYESINRVLQGRGG